MRPKTGLTQCHSTLTPFPLTPFPWKELAELYAAIRELCEGIGDTQQVAGSDIYMAYLSFYQSVRQAARRSVVGADALYENLRRFFPRGSSSTPPPNPAP